MSNIFDNLTKNQELTFNEFKELFNGTEKWVRIEIYKEWECKCNWFNYLVFKKDSVKAYGAREKTRVFESDIEAIVFKNIPQWISGKLQQRYFEIYLKGK